MPGIRWLSLDRTCMFRILTVKDGSSEHSERQRPLRNARASDGQKRHCSVARLQVTHSRVTVDLKTGLGSTQLNHISKSALHSAFKPDDEYKQHRNTGRGSSRKGGRSKAKET